MLLIALSVLLLQTTAPGAKDGYPSVSPDGRLLAFISTRTGADELFVISPDGSGEKQLTISKDQKNGPSWTRNGLIVFSTFDKESSRLFTMMPDGSNLRQIGTVPGRNPKVSPDGEQVIYAIGPWTASRLMIASLYKIRSRGSSAAIIARSGPDGGRPTESRSRMHGRTTVGRCTFGR